MYLNKIKRKQTKFHRKGENLEEKQRRINDAMKYQLIFIEIDIDYQLYVQSNVKFCIKIIIIIIHAGNIV